jgi:hypothetical protein
MPVSAVKSANFGKLRGGLLTVGYTLYDESGDETSPRTTTGVHEVGVNTGIYAAPVTFPDNFKGSILWDTGEGAGTVYASEEQNNSDSASALSADITSIKAALSDDLTFVKDMLGGQWKIDDDNFQMIFYKDDNTTEVARFDLRDNKGSPSFLSVFLRSRVS